LVHPCAAPVARHPLKGAALADRRSRILGAPWGFALPTLQ
jgi:hypothetical protein